MKKNLTIAILVTLLAAIASPTFAADPSFAADQVKPENVQPFVGKYTGGWISDRDSRFRGDVNLDVQRTDDTHVTFDATLTNSRVPRISGTAELKDGVLVVKTERLEMGFRLYGTGDFRATYKAPRVGDFGTWTLTRVKE